MRDIKEEIIAKRIQRRKEEGPSLGISVPVAREVPLIPFGRDPFLICEIKRRSPSKGNINNDLMAVEQGGIYARAGIKSVSVLTEEDYFGGSLTDLMKVKKAYPEMSILRKDFLVDIEDVDISYQAGADAILLIASALSLKELRDMYNHARKLGMQVLFEVHSEEDIDKANHIRPEITGINCRDLRTFSIDLAIPIKKSSLLKYDTKLVFESGIHGAWSARIALNNDFQALLVGESVVKKPELIPLLLDEYSKKHRSPFWKTLFSRVKKGPLVKVCGLTRLEDVQKADSLGADLLGFIYAVSPRKVELDFLETLPETSAQKVLVVQAEDHLPSGVLSLLERKKIDCIQFHGNESPEYLQEFPFPFYKAVALKNKEDWLHQKDLPSVRLLVDAHHVDRDGGDVKTIDEDLLRIVTKDKALWLAGGLRPDNIRAMVEGCRPELVDLASGIESSPGIKDHKLMEEFFKELNNVGV